MNSIKRKIAVTAVALLLAAQGAFAQDEWVDQYDGQGTEWNCTALQEISATHGNRLFMSNMNDDFTFDDLFSYLAPGCDLSDRPQVAEDGIYWQWSGKEDELSDEDFLIVPGRYRIDLDGEILTLTLHGCTTRFGNNRVIGQSTIQKFSEACTATPQALAFSGTTWTVTFRRISD